MKKLLTFLILSILFTSSAYAKIDKSYVKQIYEGCINDAKQNNDYNSDSKKFCKCYANEFNKRFNNAGLIEFMNKSDQAKAQIIQKEISPPCYPTSNSSQKSNSNLIILKDCYNKDRFNSFKEWEDYEEYYVEIDIGNGVVITNQIYSDQTMEIRKKNSNENSKFYIKKYPIKNSTNRFVETGYWGNEEVWLEKLTIDLKKSFVEFEGLNVYSKEKSIMPLQCTG